MRSKKIQMIITAPTVSRKKCTNGMLCEGVERLTLLSRLCFLSERTAGKPQLCDKHKIAFVNVNIVAAVTVSDIGNKFAALGI